MIKKGELILDMTFEEFINIFQNWRKNNNYPKRDFCREEYRKHVTMLKDYPNTINSIKENCWELYIDNQAKPSTFLDSLFSADGEITKLDKIRIEQEKNTQSYLNSKLKDELKIEECVDCLYKYIKKHNYIPKFSVLNNILSFRADKYFNNETELYIACTRKYDDIDKYILNEETFNDEYRKNTLEAIKNKKRYFITTAVSSKKVNKNLLNSIKTYLNTTDSICLILPCEDVINRKSAFSWQLSPELKQDDFYIIYKDTYLNDSIYISDIKVSAKQINPQTGLPQLTQDGNVIIASPKQDLDFIANSNNCIPNAIMTTGAITENDYSNDLYMSQRLNKIAEYEHVLGGIIVEIENNKVFHFRQVQMGKDGEIIDLGIIYKPDGSVSKAKNSVMVIGDSHFGEHDEEILPIEHDMIDIIGINNLVLHDIFSAISITHHDKNKTVTLARKALTNNISLEVEAEMVANLLDSFADNVDGQIIIVDSNHHSHLDNYLEEGRYAFDKVNLRYSLDIVKAMIDGEILPLRYMIENQTSFKNKDKTKWLEPNEDFNFYGVEISQHGHRGANGAKGSLTTYRKAYKKSMSAHTHQPKILKGAVSVGTSSKLRLSYNIGLSSWVQGVGIIYANGTYQLINIINYNNKYSWKIPNEDITD